MLIESLVKATVDLQGFRVVKVLGDESGLMVELGADGRYTPRCGQCGERARYRDTRCARRFRHVPRCPLGGGAKAHRLRNITGLLDRLEGPVDDAAMVVNRAVEGGTEAVDEAHRPKLGHEAMANKRRNSVSLNRSSAYASPTTDIKRPSCDFAAHHSPDINLPRIDTICDVDW